MDIEANSTTHNNILSYAKPYCTRKGAFKRIKASWVPPELDWENINVNASFCKDNVLNHIGLVLRDSNNVFGAARAFSRRFASSEEGEALAVLSEIFCAQERGSQRMIIETDAEAIYSFCKNGDAAISWTITQTISAPSTEMWRYLLTMKKNLQNIKKSSRVADENMFGNENEVVIRQEVSIFSNLMKVSHSFISCISPQSHGGDHGVWVSDEFARMEEINNLMVNDSLRYAIFI
ncbi:hypothetical protein GIB67_013362 [Kingdonia uniflora]|uniref:RNase H type-1 domain-containing protein n=1 Tax=Kingdonia uniflora TaxID=39325 RepID=A0A7J7LQT0_9MAGN|nr:hypothetical protein GIB67_013362 [Kingdonia uniflora]